MADVMTRYARLYSDGSLNVSNEGEREEKARHMLNESRDDDDTALVQIELTIVRRRGTRSRCSIRPPQAAAGMGRLALPKP